MSLHSMEIPETTLGSFWEVGQYRRTVKRCDDGYKMATEMTTLLAERADIEKKYAKSLKAWSKKWNDFLDKGPEYGTNKSAWRATLTEADRKCELHKEIGTKLQENIIQSIKGWQKENYHKKMMNGFKETIELDEGFRKAQKQWAHLLKKMQTAQTKYYTCCKQQKSAEIQEKAADGDTTLSPDQVKKLQEKHAKCRQETLKAKDKYQSSIDDINEHNPRYMEDMTLQFNKAQDFEKKRLQFFRETFIDVHKVLDLSTNEKFSKVYTEYMNSLQNADPEKDLKWWKTNHGTGMAMSWPAYEEYSEQVHAISKKSIKNSSVSGGGGADGIVVSSYRSTSEFSNQDNNDINNMDSWGNYDSYSRQSSHTSGRYRKLRKTNRPVPAPRKGAYKPRVSRRVYENTKTYEYVNVPGYTQRTQEDGYGNFDSHPGYQQHPDYYYNCRPNLDGQDANDNNIDDIMSEDEEDLMTKPGVQVKALYDYEPVEDDELSFKAGDILTKLKDEDEQGWCQGRIDGRVGFYPANYAVEV